LGVNNSVNSLLEISMCKKINSIIIIFVSFLAFSCESKETPIGNLEDLTEEIIENSKDYSDEDWEEAALQYQQIEADLDKHRSEYSDLELREIGKMKGKCLAIFAKRSAKDFKENIKDLMHEASGILEGFSEGLCE